MKSILTIILAEELNHLINRFWVHNSVLPRVIITKSSVYRGLITHKGADRPHVTCTLQGHIAEYQYAQSLVLSMFHQSISWLAWVGWGKITLQADLAGLADIDSHSWGSVCQFYPPPQMRPCCVISSHIDYSACAGVTVKCSEWILHCNIWQQNHQPSNERSKS